MLQWCNHESIINRGHLNDKGEKTAMVARCFLSRHDRNTAHRYVYEHILEANVEKWKNSR